MRILAIESSTKTGSVAIVSESAVIAQYSLNIEVTHSERLMTTVDRVLCDTGIALSDIDGFGVAIGPGSFTGLRIGISTIKGLALVTEKPVAAVSTLKALAHHLPHSAFPVCPLLDARKNEVYAALFQYENGDCTPLLSERTIPLAHLAEEIKGKTIFIGEAAQAFRAELESFFGERALFAPPSLSLPSAAAVGELALAMIKRGEQTDPDTLVPMYIRRPEAEVAWEKRNPSR